MDLEKIAKAVKEGAKEGTKEGMKNKDDKRKPADKSVQSLSNVNNNYYGNNTGQNNTPSLNHL